MTTTTPTPTPETCGWLVQRTVPWINEPDFEPDFPEDTYRVEPCGDTVLGDARHALCTYHQAVMDLPEHEFDRISDLHDGRAWS